MQGSGTPINSALGSSVSNRPRRANNPAAPSDDQIYQEIFSAIVEQRISPGTKLTEDTIAEIFGVSRTRIAKALQRLVHEGIVTRYRHRGAFVARPTIKEAREVFAARCLIEGEVLATAAKKATKKDIAALRRLVADERKAHKAADQQAAILLSGEFHLRIATIAGNATLRHFLSALIARTSLIIAVYQRSPLRGCSDHDHGNLVETLASGDGRKAANSVVSHLRRIEAELDFSDKPPAVDLHQAFVGTATRAKGPA